MPTFVPDHVAYLCYFLAGLALAVALGAYLFVRSRSRLPIERLALSLCPPVVFITLTLTGFRVIQTPLSDWDAARLAPTIALLSGAKIYVGPGASGALMHTNFPPVAYLAYVPAGVFNGVTDAILTGSCISLFLYLAPTAFMGFWPRRDGGHRRSALMGVVSLLVLLQAALTSKSLNHLAFSIHADAPMLALLGFAALALYRQQRDKPLSLGTCLLSTACASMAVWSQLSAAPMILILPIWVLATRGVRDALRYSLYLAMAAAISTLLFRTLFGVSAFSFNILEIPRKYPWLYQGPQFLDGLIIFSTEFFCSILVFVTSILLAVIARWSFTPVDPTDPDAKAGGFQHSLVENPWLLFVLMAFAAIPTSLWNRITFGGYWNNYAPTLYFLTMGLIALLLDWHTANLRRGRESLNALLALSLLLLVLSPLTCSEDNFKSFQAVGRPSRNAQEIAYRFSKHHPGAAYFPWNPLSNLLGEGKLYDFERGLFDRELIGYPATKRHVRENLPDNLRYVCFPPHYRGAGSQYEQTMKYLPEFDHRVAVQELPGWTCYERGQTLEQVRR